MFNLASIFKIFTGNPDPTDFSQQYYPSGSSLANQLVKKEGYGGSASGSGWGGSGPGWNDGWKTQPEGWGGDTLNPTYYTQDGQTSPAISALTLLAFLFLLGVIQNSLNLNQQLLTTTVVTSDSDAGSSSSSTSTSQSSSSSSSISGTINGENFVNPSGVGQVPFVGQQPFRRMGTSKEFRKNRIKRSLPAIASTFSNTSTPDLNLALNDVFKGFQMIGMLANYTLLDTGGKWKNGTSMRNHNGTTQEDKAQSRDDPSTQDDGLYNSIRKFDLVTKIKCLQVIASSCHVGRSSAERRAGKETIKKIIGAKLIEKLYTKVRFAKKLINALILKIQTKKLCFHIYKQCVLRGKVDSYNHGWTHEGWSH